MAGPKDSQKSMLISSHNNNNKRPRNMRYIYINVSVSASLLECISLSCISKQEGLSAKPTNQQAAQTYSKYPEKKAEIQVTNCEC